MRLGDPMLPATASPVFNFYEFYEGTAEHDALERYLPASESTPRR